MLMSTFAQTRRNAESLRDLPPANSGLFHLGKSRSGSIPTADRLALLYEPIERPLFDGPVRVVEATRAFNTACERFRFLGANRAGIAKCAGSDRYTQFLISVYSQVPAATAP